ncbi:MAG TPA: ABC transporter ATP-binding protein [Candidatus Anaerostipes excrementavium]|uniref:ABC-type quaternary amine transporter n=1 Tax=Candidatus Anaerostipes excrementavium TaxID=2838463 RepID=A0A9D2BA26_9FIRM|nr:ABC transporter ATP-binding protein [uncultured Anaerostipes sp.]HIX68473.1 ABC transporter ATP-binding protein [Candidatus Anaerostipes excrementavium]
MAAIIEFQDIAKKYGEKTIMEHFNLSVEEEEFLTIIGSSGCGKTTMLKMVNGLISPDEGNVRVWKEDVAKTDQIKLRRSIGYSIQGNVLFPHMTVEENISYVPDLLNRRDKKKTREAVAKWMEIVGLSDDMRNRFPSELSGGQQQRVGIVRALAASPEILLMDEPFGAVDEITRSQLQKEIKRIHQKTGVTILFVTHDIGEALYLGTKVLVLDHGEIQQYGTPEEIKKHPSNEFVKKLLYNRQDKYGEAAIG